jgi:hypothetical protein
MNDLSWFLYLAGVFGNLGQLLSILFVAGMIGAGFALVISGILRSLSYCDEDDIKRSHIFFGSALKIFLVAIISGVLCSVIPSRDTMYAIAASEMGEEALKSPIATKAGKALEAWLDQQINKAQQAPAQ